MSVDDNPIKLPIDLKAISSDVVREKRSRSFPPLLMFRIAIANWFIVSVPFSVCMMIGVQRTPTEVDIYGKHPTINS